MHACLSSTCNGRSVHKCIHVKCRHTLEELEQLVEAAKSAVPGVDAAIAAAIDRKVNPVSCADPCSIPYLSLLGRQCVQ